MQSNEFIEQIRKLENNYKYTLSEDQLKLWWNEFKELDINTFSRAIDKTITSCNKFPRIAEIRSNITTNRMNLNSSFWYANFKDIRPCFDIITGEPLEPYN